MQGLRQHARMLPHATRLQLPHLMGALLAISLLGLSPPFLPQVSAQSPDVRQVMSETDLLGALAFQLNPRILNVTQSITLQGTNQVNQLVIKSSITIQGAPGLFIDGNGNTALFNVTTGGSLVIQDLEIRNGYRSTSGNVGGAALYVSGQPASATIRRVNFTNNVASGALSGGGAIEVVGAQSSLNASDCTFIANKAAFGGAVEVSGANASAYITNCQFTGNAASFGGGAIQVIDSGTVHCISNTFTNNTAGIGGSVAVEGPALRSTLYICNYKHTGNLAFTSGNDIAALRGSLINYDPGQLTDSQFFAIVTNSSNLTLNAYRDSPPPAFAKLPCSCDPCPSPPRLL